MKRTDLISSKLLKGGTFEQTSKKGFSSKQLKVGTSKQIFLNYCLFGGTIIWREYQANNIYGGTFKEDINRRLINNFIQNLTHSKYSIIYTSFGNYEVNIYI